MEVFRTDDKTEMFNNRPISIFTILLISLRKQCVEEQLDISSKRRPTIFCDNQYGFRWNHSTLKQ